MAGWLGIVNLAQTLHFGMERICYCHVPRQSNRMIHSCHVNLADTRVKKKKNERQGWKSWVKATINRLLMARLSLAPSQSQMHIATTKIFMYMSEISVRDFELRRKEIFGMFSWDVDFHILYLRFPLYSYGVSFILFSKKLKLWQNILNKLMADWQDINWLKRWATER